jgi:sulfur carrier protein ThiS adenylyltransferase
MDLNQIFKRNPPGLKEKLSSRVVGIAGAGGLGSNAAVALARTGVERFIIADFDTVELSNLNRQQFFLEQVGQKKVEALKDNLLKINPCIAVEAHCIKLTSNNIPEIFGKAEILIEAFDLPDQKAMLANKWLSEFPERFIVTASGISGYGNLDKLTAKRNGKMIVCGDFTTEASSENGLTAARVAIVANMQADIVIELLVDMA